MYGIYTIYTYICLNFMVNVGKYTSPMDAMGYICIFGSKFLDTKQTKHFKNRPRAPRAKEKDSEMLRHTKMLKLGFSGLGTTIGWSHFLFNHFLSVLGCPVGS